MCMDILLDIAFLYATIAYNTTMICFFSKKQKVLYFQPLTSQFHASLCVVPPRVSHVYTVATRRHLAPCTCAVWYAASLLLPQARRLPAAYHPLTYCMPLISIVIFPLMYQLTPSQLTSVTLWPTPGLPTRSVNTLVPPFHAGRSFVYHTASPSAKHYEGMYSQLPPHLCTASYKH